MFNDSIITEKSPLFNFFKELKFDLLLTKPQLENMDSILSGMVQKGFNGKISDIAECKTHKHRTSFGRFLSQSTFNDDLVVDGLH